MRPAHRLAVLTAAATGVLIVFGGLVTNTGAAMAVPDWPTTFGHNMFLFPLSGMVGGVFYEHSHRLLGALVGLLTLALAATLWRAGGRLRALGVVAVVAVVLQGVIGGLRVVLSTDALAMIHGPFAQAFFAFVVALALLTSPRMAVPAPALDAATRGLTVATAALVYLQIVFGALLTHAGYLAVHLLGALAVFVVAPLATARLRRSGDAVAAPAARVALVLLGLQLVLGAGSYLARFSAIWIPGGQLTILVVPVAHRLAGGLLLATAVVLAVRVLATARPAAARDVARARPAVGVAR
ncbi:MAG TPA: COX15/CtaA family protein [Candidatus Binatia bacterium]|nr:COX15/CtaA family protein [Candidatus Binatia bacterium]